MKIPKDSYTMQLMSKQYQYNGQRDWGRLRYLTIRMISFPDIRKMQTNLDQYSSCSNICSMNKIFRRSNVAFSNHGNEIEIPCDCKSKYIKFDNISQDNHIYRFE